MVYTKWYLSEYRLRIWIDQGCRIDPLLECFSLMNIIGKGRWQQSSLWFYEYWSLLWVKYTRSAIINNHYLKSFTWECLRRTGFSQHTAFWNILFITYCQTEAEIFPVTYNNQYNSLYYNSMRFIEQAKSWLKIAALQINHYIKYTVQIWIVEEYRNLFPL